jgi:hypothetical protein
MRKGLVTKAVEVVGVLFAAFGGFLGGIAPPQDADAKYAVGISSFLALIILLWIAAVSKTSLSRWWTTLALVLLVIAAIAAYGYKRDYDALAFEYPPGKRTVEHIAGMDLTPRAAEKMREDPTLSNSQLLTKFGGLPSVGKVWTENSIERARMRLTVGYVVLVLSLAGAVFSLTEGASREWEGS